MARLVNKQFNSPIGLYSEQNIRDVIERDSQILANGAVGINFNNPGAGKPSNLQNSAVLRMLEEEEQRQRNGQAPSIGYRPLRDDIKWPPPEFEQKNHQRTSFKDVVTPGLKRVAWPPPNEGENYSEQPPAQVQGGPQYSSQSHNLQNNYTPAAKQQPPQRYNTSPLQPLDISGTNNGIVNQPNSPLAINQSPSVFRPSTPSSRWAPVHSPGATSSTSPVSQPQFVAQPAVAPWQQAPTSPPQQYQPVLQPAHPSPQQNNYYQPPSPHNQILQQSHPTSATGYSPAVAAPFQAVPYQQQSVRPVVEPPPTTITLRQQAPVSQAPPPVVTSQPATATLQGGKNLRGDTKWPPENVKSQMDEENRQRIELAKGPAFRPRLVRKDYGAFFAQHALNASYPGYKAPPGTQFYDPSRAY